MLRESSHRSLTCGCSTLDRETGSVAWGCGPAPGVAGGAVAAGGDATGRCCTAPNCVGAGLDGGRAWTEGCGAPNHVGRGRAAFGRCGTARGPCGTAVGCVLRGGMATGAVRGRENMTEPRLVRAAAGVR